ncbi:MAG: RagB/SusD family nutrient uptake outer membrane protein [Candidatus Kapabacteria bacterium]|jgi:hypothetical protein|nr:RagB/SusD family nutrient uptake outer membrane protein [Candidatus Kapabacteria bacterium]
MKFQRLLLITTSVMTIVGMTSCQPDYNFPDPNAATPQTATIQALVTGTLASFRARQTGMDQEVAMIGREIFVNAGDDPRWINEHIGGRLDAAGPFVNNPWTAMYRCIGNCQVLLDRAKDLPAAQRAGLEGFANTLMAHHLLMASNSWNEIGIKLEYRFTPDAPVVRRTEALAAIARRLDEANTQLRSAGATFGFRLHSGYTGFDTPANFARFNRALRARVAAYQSDYATCTAALRESFLSESNTEADMRLGIYNVFSLESGDATNYLFQNIAAPTIRFWAHPDYVAQNRDTAVDKRVLNKVVVPANIRVPFTMAGGEGAYRSSHILAIYRVNTAPMPVMRNEELLLLRAEASALGAAPNLTAATEDINRVRAAAGAPPIAALTDRESAITQILYERRYSLFTEGHRWVDVRRFGRLNTLPRTRATDVQVVSYPLPTFEVPVP